MLGAMNEHLFVQHLELNTCCKQYSGYLELVAEHTEFKGTKRELNKVLKTLGVTPLTLKQEFSKVGGKG